MRASSGDSSNERAEVRGAGAASNSSSGNVDVDFRAMNAVELPKTSANGLNISGFRGSAVTLFTGFLPMYCI